MAAEDLINAGNRPRSLLYVTQTFPGQEGRVTLLRARHRLFRGLDKHVRARGENLHGDDDRK